MYFNDCFVNIVPNLGIRTQHEFPTDNSQDPIDNAIFKILISSEYCFN